MFKLSRNSCKGMVEETSRNRPKTLTLVMPNSSLTDYLAVFEFKVFLPGPSSFIRGTGGAENTFKVANTVATRVTKSDGIPMQCVATVLECSYRQNKHTSSKHRRRAVP